MPPTAQVENTFGWLFIGAMAACALWGVTCIQTWWYFDHYRKDTFWLKIIVAITWVSDTVHQALITYAVYKYTISHWGDLDFIVSMDMSMYVEVLFNAATALFVQSFFIWRIWTFRQNPVVVVVVGILVLSALGTSVAYVTVGIVDKLDTVEKLKRLKALSMAVNVTTAVSDIAIAAAICTFLNASRTGFGWSNNVINRLMMFSINTGIVTALCACLSLIFILALPNTLVYFCCYFTIGRLYSNSLLATLNLRDDIRNGHSDLESIGISFDRPIDSQIIASNAAGGVTVQIGTIKEFHGTDVDGASIQAAEGRMTRLRDSKKMDLAGLAFVTV